MALTQLQTTARKLSEMERKLERVKQSIKDNTPTNAYFDGLDLAHCAFVFKPELRG